MKTNFAPVRSPRAAGYALVLVMVFMGISLMVLTGAMSWTSTSSRLTDHHNRYQEAVYAAEAATEKVLARMMRDYKVSGEGVVYDSLGDYRTLVPTTAENNFWANFIFTDGQGNQNRVYVSRTATATYQPLNSQYAGLFGYASNYRIVANAQSMGNISQPVGAVQQDVQLATIPLFQFAIFYNMYLDLNPGENMEVRGRVHANGEIWTGPNGNLRFYGDVTSTGRNTRTRHPNDPGYSSTLNNKVTYYGNKDTNTTTLAMPIGTNNSPDAVWEVLAKPPAGESASSPMGRERFFNKAEMLILVSNTTVTVQVKTPYGPASTNIPWNQVSGFISTNKTFYDQRESKTMRVTEIDVGKFRTFALTNLTVRNTLGNNVVPNLLYVSDDRSASSSQLTAVRLVNGQTLPERGLTVATPNPLYTVGNFNCPNSSHLNTTNTTQTRPAALISDALTVLSANWDDSQSSGSYSTRVAANTTVNAAIMTGNVPWNPPNTPTKYYSGGAHNLTRYLEKWSGKTITYNTSLVCMFASKRATGLFQQSGGYYDIPTRELYFDNNFTDPAKLPPGTPQVRALVRGKWVNPPPNMVTYAGN